MTHVDLHMHTMYSDGSLDPKSLVRVVKLKNIDVFAITDHDNINGYLRAIDEANKWNIKLIPGVEMTTKDYHILALNVNPSDASFQDFLAKIRSYQEDNCVRRIDVLQRHGVPISLDKLKGYFPESRLGKYNIFMAMLQDSECRAYLTKNHYDKSPYEIFCTYLKKDGIAGNIKAYEVSHQEAIAKIHEAGGIAVLAHPFKNVEEMKEVDELVSYGLDGIEYQPNYGDKNIPYAEYASKHGLFMTYGSDYHGASMPRALLGRKENKIEGLDEILNRHRRKAA